MQVEFNGQVFIVRRIVDLPEQRVVRAFVSGIVVVLWEGEAYDTLGDWTYNDVVSRLVELSQGGNFS